MKPATITKMARRCRREWNTGSMRVFFRLLDEYRGKINRAVSAGKLTHDDAQAAWTDGYTECEVPA